MCLGVFLLGFILYGTFWAFWTWGNFDYNLFKNLLIPFLFLFFWNLYNSNVRVFDIALEVSETILSSFHSLFCSLEVIYTILPSSSLYSSASDILLLIPSRVFLISVIVLFVSVCSFFNSSNQFTSVQLLSCVWFFASPWTATRQASLSIINSWSLLKLRSVHQVGDTVQPSHPLSSPSPPAPNPSQHQKLFHWVNSSHEVAKVVEFQLQHQSFQWTPRTDLL